MSARSSVLPLAVSSANKAPTFSNADDASYDSEADHGHGHGPRRGRQLGWQDVWHAMKTEKRFNLAHWINVTILLLVDSLFQKAGVLLVSLATLLIGYIAYVALFLMLPIVASTYSLWWWWNVLFGMYLLGSVYFNYIMSVCTPPGSAHDAASSPQAAKLYAFTAECPDIPTMHSQGLLKVCSKCVPAAVKPPRSHHCRVCQQCTAKMDHHCPWINNCVGHGNYRYFFLFMFYVWLATLYIAVVLTPYAFGDRTPLIRELGVLTGYQVVSAADREWGGGAAGAGAMQVGPQLPPFLGQGVEGQTEGAGSGRRRWLQGAPPLPRGLHRAKIVHLSDDAAAVQHQTRTHSPHVHPQQPQQPQQQQQQQQQAASTPVPVLAAQTASEPGAAQGAGAGTGPKEERGKDGEGEEDRGKGREKEEAGKRSRTRGGPKEKGKKGEAFVLVVWCVCAGLVLSVGSLCGFHLYLILHNLTTLELFRWFSLSKAEAAVWVNPYDTGSMLGNFRSVFGGGNVLLALVPSTRKPPPVQVVAGGMWNASWTGRDGDRDGGSRV